MPAYYSEFDPKAAAWLRELIKQGHIADGEVDERDLWDVAPADLAGFTQVHLCAGIGVWSYALRSAGWADDRPVWTGSFPCQPFSAAGKGEGFADERHLWPAGFHLIEQCRPDVLFGEQVSSKDGLAWFDLVSSDLEGSGYAVGALDTCSAGVGAPHIRQRLYWSAQRLADAASGGRGEFGYQAQPGRVRHADGGEFAGRVVDTVGERGRSGQSGGEDAGHAGVAGEAGGLANANGGHASAERQQRGGEQRQQPQDGDNGRVADPDSRQRDGLPELRGPERNGQDAGRTQGGGELEPRRDDAGVRESGRHVPDGPGAERKHGPRDLASPAGPVNGLWRDADWLFCRDGKWRPVESGTFPLAHGTPARVGRLRGYGNAINAAAAQAWIESYLDTRTIEAGA